MTQAILQEWDTHELILQVAKQTYTSRHTDIDRYSCERHMHRKYPRKHAQQFNLTIVRMSASARVEADALFAGSHSLQYHAALQQTIRGTVRKSPNSDTTATEAATKLAGVELSGAGRQARTGSAFELGQRRARESEAPWSAVTIRPDILTDEEREMVTALEKAAAGSVGCRGGGRG